MIYILKRSVLIFKNKNSLFVSGGIKGFFEIEENKEFYVRFFSIINQEPFEIPFVLQELRNYGLDLDEENLLEIINDLMNKNIITEFKEYSGNILTNHSMQKYDRQMGFISRLGFSMEESFEMQENISIKHVMILGVGGVVDISLML